MTEHRLPLLENIPSDWEIKTLGDVADITKLAGYEFTKHIEYIDDGEVIALRSLNVVDGQLDLSNVKKISQKASDALPRSKLLQDDLLLTYTGSKLGNTAIIDRSGIYHLAPNVCRLRALNRNDTQYLYLYLRSACFAKVLDGFKVGSGQPTVPMKNIRKVPIPWPDENIRKSIGCIYISINNKPVINRQINQTLEQMAQAIFKGWFVDFEPVKAKIAALEAGSSEEGALLAAMQAISGKDEAELSCLQAEQPEQYSELRATAELFPSAMQESELGEIPVGWSVSQIGDEVTVVGGGTPSTKKPELWENGDINWTSPRDLSNLPDKVLVETERKITEAGLAKISSGLLPINTVLMSSRAPVGYLAMAKIPVAVNQGYIAMKCEKVLSPEFVIQWCEAHMDEIKSRASGTTFSEISKKNFKIIPVVVPSESLMSAYTRQVSPLYEAIEVNVRESDNLAQLRDTLLPKLLSGELSLPNTVSQPGSQDVADATA